MVAFLKLLPILLELLPSVISFIEQVFGPAKGQSSTKLGAAVDLVQTLVPAVAPHLTDDPVKLKAVQEVISLGVSLMNASGMMPKPVAPTTATPLNSTPAGA